ncbi:MAG TPA: LytTR family DNA-binding domain-containing protein [Puia sp.]
MIKCIIIDDEPLAQEVLENYINRSTQLGLVKKCMNALEAFHVLHTERVGLMFLDIKMPGINGLDFVRSLKNPPAVIFTTAYADHAITGFELEAVDYLLKPITYERFQKCITKLLKAHPPEPEEQKNYSYFKVSGKLLKIPYAELLYAQSVKDYILLCTTKGNYLTHMTMKYLNHLLPAQIFVRVHRSYLVNKNYVTLIDKNSLKTGNETIPVGESYRQNLEFII